MRDRCDPAESRLLKQQLPSGWIELRRERVGLACAQLPLRFVTVHVTVRADRHHGVRVRVLVRVMAIVVAVCVLVFLRVMDMFVRVTLGQVQNDAGDHQDRGNEHPQAACAFAQHEGQARADEGR